jgi:serine/threonine protein kinase
VGGTIGGLAFLGALAFFLARRRNIAKAGSAVRTHALAHPLMHGDGDGDGAPPPLPEDEFTSVASPASGGADPAPVVYTLAQIEGATGGFDAKHLLEEGACGAVFRGVIAGRAVAIKVLKPKAAAVKVAKKHEQFVGAGSFHKELEILEKYKHQNIVELLGHCLSDDPTARQCLVFELMEGGSLKSRIGGGPALAVQQRFDVASDIARGLEYLHTQADPPIIHQDVKSDNILLAEIDGRLVAKVADFGTARYVPTLLEGNNTHHTTGIVIGTTPYMPLEYIQQGRVSEKTDTYAFGVVLCELLTGKPPSDPDSGEMLAMAMHEQLGPHSIERELPPLLAGGAATWPLPRALALGRIARHCIDNQVSKRCTIRDVLVDIDVLAGRMAVMRAGRGEEFDPRTGKLVQKVRR